MVGVVPITMDSQYFGFNPAWNLLRSLATTSDLEPSRSLLGTWNRPRVMSVLEDPPLTFLRHERLFLPVLAFLSLFACKPIAQHNCQYS
eukprot:UN08442